MLKPRRIPCGRFFVRPLVSYRAGPGLNFARLDTSQRIPFGSIELRLVTALTQYVGRFRNLNDALSCAKGGPEYWTIRDIGDVSQPVLARSTRES